jgi:hypothetical protein
MMRVFRRADGPLLYLFLLPRSTLRSTPRLRSSVYFRISSTRYARGGQLAGPIPIPRHIDCSDSMNPKLAPILLAQFTTSLCYLSFRLSDVKSFVSRVRLQYPRTEIRGRRGQVAESPWKNHGRIMIDHGSG